MNKSFTFSILIFLLTACGNPGEDIVDIVESEDEIKPVLTLVGEARVELHIGDKYREFGASAVDDVDGDISEKIVIKMSVNTEKSGTYFVEYNVSDEAGNKADPIQREVFVGSTKRRL